MKCKITYGHTGEKIRYVNLIMSDGTEFKLSENFTNELNINKVYGSNDNEAITIKPEYSNQISLK